MNICTSVQNPTISTFSLPQNQDSSEELDEPSKKPPILSGSLEIRHFNGCLKCSPLELMSKYKTHPTPSILYLHNNFKLEKR